MLTMLFGHCTTMVVQSQSDAALTIRTGTSFGFCRGYCRNDYTFAGTSVTLTQNSSADRLPTKVCQTTINADTWTTLKGLADLETFSKQPATIGCPDCADGGAEYIELQTGTQTYRVTFPYGKTIPGFESIVSTLRQQRDGFKECP